MKDYLKLIRYQNLLFLALVQFLIEYALFRPLRVESDVDFFAFLGLVFATLCIAGAGNVINDIHDGEIDKINKPERVLIGKSIPETKAFIFYIILSVLGITMGGLISFVSGHPYFSFIFIFIPALLFYYSYYLKGIMILGNIVVSALVAFSLLLVALFHLPTYLLAENKEPYAFVFQIVFHYAIFAFCINYTREITKDLEDINGDKNAGLNTLPIVIGRRRTTRLVFLLGATIVFGTVYYIFHQLRDNILSMFYFIVLILVPLLYFCFKAWDAETKKEYAFLSKFLKIIMFLGMCSLLLFQF